MVRTDKPTLILVFFAIFLIVSISFIPSIELRASGVSALIKKSQKVCIEKDVSGRKLQSLFNISPSLSTKFRFKDERLSRYFSNAVETSFSDESIKKIARYLESSRFKSNLKSFVSNEEFQDFIHKEMKKLRSQNSQLFEKINSLNYRDHLSSLNVSLLAEKFTALRNKKIKHICNFVMLRKTVEKIVSNNWLNALKDFLRRSSLSNILENISIFLRDRSPQCIIGLFLLVLIVLFNIFKAVSMAVLEGLVFIILSGVYIAISLMVEIPLLLVGLVFCIPGAIAGTVVGAVAGIVADVALIGLALGVLAGLLVVGLILLPVGGEVLWEIALYLGAFILSIYPELLPAILASCAAAGAMAGFSIPWVPFIGVGGILLSGYSVLAVLYIAAAVIVFAIFNPVIGLLILGLIASIISPPPG